MISRYSTTPKPIFKRESLTYYVLSFALVDTGVLYRAFDSSTSALLASAETLEELTTKMLFLGYRSELDAGLTGETK